MSGEERREPVAPGYKMTEVGVIPEEWGVYTIGTEFRIELGKMLDGQKNVGRPVPYVGNRAVQWKNIDVEAIGTIRIPREELARYRLEPGDLLVCEGGEIGRASLWHAEIEECYYQKAVHRLRSIGHIDSEYLLHLLERWGQTGYLLDEIGQTSIAHLPKEKLERVRMAAPPLPEQRAIAEALSDVDNLLDALDRLIAKKRAVKQAAMQQLLTGKTRLPGFAGEWEETTLGDRVEFLNNGSQSRSQLSTQGSVRYVHYGDIHLMKTPYLDVSQQGLPFVDRQLVENLSRLKDGDTIFADASEDLQGVGKAVELRSVGRHEVVSGLHTIVARFDPQIIAIGFPAFMQYHPDFRQQLERLASGTKVYAVTSSQIATIKLRIPPLPEQRAIAEVLSDMDEEITALEKRRDKTRRIKEGMMQQLLTGRVRLLKSGEKEWEQD